MVYDENELLGAAERHVAAELRSAFKAAQENATTLARSLDEVDLDGIEAALLDPKRKDAVIGMVDPIQKLNSSLTVNGLIPLIAGVVLKPPVGGAS